MKNEKTQTTTNQATTNQTITKKDNNKVRVLDRREMLNVLGATSIGAFLGMNSIASAQTETAATTGGLPSCIISPQMTEGPYFVDEQLLRADVRSDAATGQMVEGTKLDLNLRVLNINAVSCEPLANVWVDIWHCDAYGAYSGVTDRGVSREGTTFLRGSQITDENGNVSFTTIYPGWYPSRAVHIHFKLRSTDLSDQHYTFTSQFFFDEALTDEVYKSQPYAGTGQRQTLNSTDNIYGNGGYQLQLNAEKTEEGYTAAFDIGMQLN